MPGCPDCGSSLIENTDDWSWTCSKCKKIWKLDVNGWKEVPIGIV